MLETEIDSMKRHRKTIEDSSLVLYSSQDNYMVVGDDALLVAESLYKTTTVLKNGTCSLTKTTAVPFLRDLVLSHRIEIYEIKDRRWILIAQASPGNLLQVEDLLFQNSDLASSPVIAAVNVQQNLVGIALTDASSGAEILVAEFLDNEVYSNLEAILVQQNVKEAVMYNCDQTLQKLLQKSSVAATMVPKKMFEDDNLAQDLQKLIGNNIAINSLPVLELKLAMKSTASLIAYLSLMQDQSNFGTFKLEKFDLLNYLRLDISAVQALNLVPGVKDTNKSMSLYGILNRCKTAQGSRLLMQWIKQPLISIEEITERQQFVELFVENSSIREGVHGGPLSAFPDLHRIGKKFQRKKSHLQDVIRVYQVVKSIPKLIAALSEYDGEFKSILVDKFISPIEETYVNLQKLEELVEQTLDLEAADRHEYLIKPEFNEDLKKLKNSMNETFAKLAPEAKRVADELGLEYQKKLKFENNPQYGHHLRVSRADASKIRSQSDFIELRTQRAGILFTTTVLRRLSQEHSELAAEYKKASSNISKEIIEIVGEYFPILEELNRIVARLDVLVSFAVATVYAPIAYVKPKLTLEKSISLKGCRHPCVEQQDDVSYIENDVHMDENAQFLTITGPNMGGKSTYIRSIGVTVLMAQIGCFVPCESATIGIRDAILARVGAGDSQLRGVSTFMAEMLETSAILKTATEKSLIIIDELGRGTSTKDGFGLASAIAEYIANIGCLTLFATHFHEITALEEKLPVVKNFHVSAHVTNSKELVLLYKVSNGCCDQSFGIHVAELAKFPNEVVRIAKRKAAELEGFEDSEKLGWKSKKDFLNGSKIILQFLNDAKVDCKDDLATSLPALLDKYKNEFENEFIKEIVNEF